MSINALPHHPAVVFCMLVQVLGFNLITGRCGRACQYDVPIMARLGIAELVATRRCRSW